MSGLEAEPNAIGSTCTNCSGSRIHSLTGEIPLKDRSNVTQVKSQVGFSDKRKYISKFSQMRTVSRPT